MGAATPVTSPRNGRNSVHLVVLIHGLWGTPEHLSVAHEELLKTHSSLPSSSTSPQPRLHALIAKGNKGTRTYDGMDVCAGRVMLEVKREIRGLEKAGERVEWISVMGYSLGGLVARYLIGLLSATPTFFQTHRPYSFTTIATPHLGILKYKSKIWQWVAVKYGFALLGRSGDQLYFWDKFDESSTAEKNDEEVVEGTEKKLKKKLGGRPLLEVMADPEGVFNKALNQFERVDFFANVAQDATVPYPTGGMDIDDPFTYNPEPPSGSETIIEVNPDRIITRWYTVKTSNLPPLLVQQISQSRFASLVGYLRKWIPGMGTGKVVLVGEDVGSGQKEDDQRGVAQIVRANTIPRASSWSLPPFLRFHRPWNWLFYASFPIIMPILWIIAVIVFHIHAFTSRRRVRGIAPPSSNANTPNSTTPIIATTALPNPVAQFLQPDSRMSSSGGPLISPTVGLPTTELTRLILRAHNQASSNAGVRSGRSFPPISSVMDQSSNPFFQHVDGAIENVITTGNADNRKSSLGMESDCSTPFDPAGSQSDSSEETLVDGGNGDRPDTSTMKQMKQPYRHGTILKLEGSADLCGDMVPVASSTGENDDHDGREPAGSTFTPMDARLELTPLQIKVAKMLNAGMEDGLREGRIKRWLVWLPDVGNAHASIIVRDGDSVAEEEIGRNIVKLWAEMTVIRFKENNQGSDIRGGGGVPRTTQARE